MISPGFIHQNPNSITLSQYVGCRIITVDSKQSAVDFYKKFGFRQAIRTPGETVPLYLDLKSALMWVEKGE